MSYIHFTTTTRDDVKNSLAKTLANLDAKESMKAIAGEMARRWSSLSDAQKAEHQKAAQVDKRVKLGCLALVAQNGADYEASAKRKDASLVGKALSSACFALAEKAFGKAKSDEQDRLVEAGKVLAKAKRVAKAEKKTARAARAARPKKAPTSYILFTNSVRDAVRKDLVEGRLNLEGEGEAAKWQVVAKKDQKARATAWAALDRKAQMGLTGKRLGTLWQELSDADRASWKAQAELARPVASAPVAAPAPAPVAAPAPAPAPAKRLQKPRDPAPAPVAAPAPAPAPVADPHQRRARSTKSKQE